MHSDLYLCWPLIILITLKQQTKYNLIKFNYPSSILRKFQAFNSFSQRKTIFRKANSRLLFFINTHLNQIRINLTVYLKSVMRKLAFILFLVLLFPTVLSQNLHINLPPYPIGSTRGLTSDLYFWLPDYVLFRLALERKVGKCSIHLCTSGCFCDAYAKVDINGGMGLPDLYGSGCIYALDFPKRIGVCWSYPNTYPMYSTSDTPICTPSGIRNGANMIRIGLRKGHCF